MGQQIEIRSGQIFFFGHNKYHKHINTHTQRVLSIISLHLDGKDGMLCALLFEQPSQHAVTFSAQSFH